MTDDMEYALSCSICMELYNEPMLLPCAHSLCKACLERLRRPQDKPVNKTIDCPQCRQKFDYDNAKKNFQLASIIDIYRQESSRRQQLDAEGPQRQPQQCDQASQNQLAQRIHQLQLSPQGAKPKLGFLAQLRHKQTQRKKSKSSPDNQPLIKPGNSSSDDVNARAPTHIQNALAALRTRPDNPQERQSDSKPWPRRTAPLPPLPKPRGTSTHEAEQLDQTPPKIPPSRRSFGSVPIRAPPPIPPRSETLRNMYPTLNQGIDSPDSSQQPASQSDSSLVPGASPSGSHDSQSTQASEETPEPDERPNTDNVSNTPIPNTAEQPSSAPDAVPDQPNQAWKPEPDVFRNMPVRLPEVPDQTEQAECPGTNDLGPECCTCERVPAFPATVQCQTCAMLFCSDCLGAFHPEPESLHEVKPIKEIKAEEKCVLCEKEKWSMFCMECNMLLCQGCQLGHHPTQLKHWTHEAPIQRSISISAMPVQPSQPTLQRRTVSVPSGMATQGLEEATGCSADETRCSSCAKAAFARCLDCGENLCEMCARVKHQSEDLENHTVVKLSESKLNIEDVEKLVQLGLLELMLLKQALMNELSAKVQKD